jgi:hypothetical protein
MMSSNDGPLAGILQRRMGERRTKTGFTQMCEVYFAHRRKLWLSRVEVKESYAVEITVFPFDLRCRAEKMVQ